MRSLRFSALLVVVLVGCSGGSGGGTTELQARCPGGASFCLTSCNLGCVQGGCTISEIAQNQPISLEFSQMVDPASVNPATVSIKTASGEQPVGRLIVDRNKVTFQPEIRVSGGNTLFGFDAGKVYLVSLPGGAGQPQSIRSTSGDPINAAVSCSLTVSQGIVDLDRAPPEATLIAPSAGRDVSLDATIVVKFSELIDMSPFQGSGTEFSPIIYQVRTPVRNPMTGEIVFDDAGRPICDQSFEPVRIDGVPRATVAGDQTTEVSLRPNIALPSETCVEVVITEQVKDLSGRSAQPVTFRFLTRFQDPTVMQIDETFERPTKLDRITSSGTWNNFQARAGTIGGDGRHGVFDIDIGMQPNAIDFPNLHVFNTNNMVIPAENTLFGEELTVTDGRFFFTEFDLPEEKTLIFTGSNPVQIFVRGRARVAGTMLANGQDLPQWEGRPTTFKGTIQGQPGGAGGPGANRGGRGANSGNGAGTSPDFNGRDGEDVKLPAGHAYLSRAVGTGGKGAAQFPASGLTSDLSYNAIGNAISSMIAAGGGGAGFVGPGNPGAALQSAGDVPGDLGPPSVSGAGIDLFPIPAGASSLDHFMIGGSGGGGGGSHPFLASLGTPDESFRAGAAGTGGGGVVVIRAGSEVRIVDTGLVQARGGRGPSHSDTSKGLPAPGGGGSGGSILVQSGGEIVQGGLLDVQGGRGSSVFAGGFIVGVSIGGDGAPGFIRLETPGGTILPGNTIPPLSGRNSGVLTDTDPFVSSQSLWYPTRQFFPPEFLHYRLTARIDGNPVTFSDDASSGLQPANDPNRPLQIMFQAARVDPGTAEEDDRTIGPWRSFVGTNSGEDETLNLDDGTGFRFLLIFDRTMTQDIVVTGLSVFFKS